MITDIATLTEGSVISADLVIIGGGMAGITLARQWAGNARTVAILESGGRELEPATQDLYAGTATLAADGNADLAINDYPANSRARLYGGSMHWWGGKCVPLDDADFAERPWIRDSGWPMSRRDLQPYYDRASDLLGIQRFDKDFSKPQIEGRPPVDINGSVHITTLPRDNTMLSGRFGGKPFDAFLHDFTDAANIAIYLHANVVDFNMAKAGQGIDSLGVATLDGKRYTARGHVYVLACGGMENARLLLAANARNGARFGHRSDALGRYFQGHTTVGKERTATAAGTQVYFTRPPESLSLYVDRDPRAPHAVLGATLKGQKHYKGAAFTVTMDTDPQAGGADERGLQTTAARIDQAGAARPGVNCSCYFMTETIPNPLSRITLSDVNDALGVPRLDVRWEYDAHALDCFQASLDGFAGELGMSAMGRTCFPIRRDEVVAQMSPSRHHMGTTRMHADPTIGVVDTQQKSHDADNLYVAGSSVFPTSGIANPSLTIVALTLRLSDHLKQKLGA